MIDNYQTWNSASISGKQLFSGFGLIIVALIFIVSDVFIIIRDLRKKK